MRLLGGQAVSLSKIRARTDNQGRMPGVQGWPDSQLPVYQAQGMTLSSGPASQSGSTALRLSFEQPDGKKLKMMKS